MTEIVWDKRLMYVYQQTEKPLFELINKRYKEFLAVVDDVKSEPVKVFEELKMKQKNELELIREVSRELQKKKIEDIKKQNAAETDEAEKTEVESSEEPKDTPNEAVEI